MSSATPKEKAYDTQISPLVAQVIALCREHKINMFATFALDRDDSDDVLACTTAQPQNDPDDDKGAHMVEDLTHKIRGGQMVAALTTRTGKAGK